MRRTVLVWAILIWLGSAWILYAPTERLEVLKKADAIRRESGIPDTQAWQNKEELQKAFGLPSIDLRQFYQSKQPNQVDLTGFLSPEQPAPFKQDGVNRGQETYPNRYRIVALLHEAGFDGAGDLTTATKAFQSTHGLEATGTINKQTEKKLISAAENQQDLDRINSEAAAFRACIVNPVDLGSNKRAYRISFGSGNAVEVYSLDDLRDSLKKAVGPAPVYVIPEGFSSQESEGLSFSLTNKQRYNPLEVNIQVVNLQGEKIRDDPRFGKSVKRVVSDTSALQEVWIDSRPFLQKEVPLEIEGSEPIKLKVSAPPEHRGWISRFIDWLTTVLHRNTSSSLSAVALVDTALEEMRRELNLSRKDFRTLFRVQMGSIEYVEVQTNTNLVAVDQ